LVMLSRKTLLYFQKSPKQFTPLIYQLLETR